MKRILLVTIPLFAALLLGATLLGGSTPAPELDRSPIDLAVTSEGRWVVTANATSDSTSLVDLESGKPAAEVKAGKRPFCIVITPDNRRALVTNCLSNDVTVLDVNPPRLLGLSTIPIGDEPRGIAIDKAGNRAYIALAGEDSVVGLDLHSMKIVSRLEVGAEPWHLALTPDGKRLVVGTARGQELVVIDLAEWKVVESFKLRGHNARHVAVSPDGAWAYVPHISERGRPATKQDIDQGWIIGNRLTRAPLNETGPRESIALDPRGNALGDVDGLAISPDGKTIVLSAGGTHELLVFRLPLPFVSFGGPGDHIEPELLANPSRFRRIPLGGRPLGVRFLRDGHTVAVANYLSNTVQMVDIDAGNIGKTIPLGGPAEPSLARKGEAIFDDAERGFNHWYSCNSCHVEGHTNGSSFDTFNDGSYGTPKKTLSLRGVKQTGPWTWHGHQTSLRTLVHESMTKTMQGPEPTDAELDAVLAFLGTIDFRPPVTASNPEAAKRGAAIFKDRACDTCHVPPLYSRAEVYTVGLESPEDAYKGFNPPSLRGIRNRAPYLHAGQARNLNQVLTQFHRPSQLNGKSDLNPQEVEDLAAYLKTL